MKRSALIVRLPTIAAALVALMGTALSGATEPAGPMAAARFAHVAVALPDGRALVAGGFPATGWDSLSSAELFDPATATFSSTAPTLVARGRAAAALLPDGRVLVAGGAPQNFTTPSGMASAEIYDPVAATWTATGSMSIARHTATALALPDGRVMVVGGDTNGQSAEIYDPATGTFSTTGALSASRVRFAAAVLADGRVLVAGGVTSSGTFAVSTAEIWNPATGLWSATGSMSIVRINATATVLANGKVLIAGGSTSTMCCNGAMTNSELYDPATGTFTSTGSMVTAHRAHAASRMADGTVVVTGGMNASDAVSGAIERYNPVSGTWTSAGALAVPRYQHPAVSLAGGDVLVAGGGNPAIAAAEVLDLVCMTTPATISPGSASYTSDAGTGGVDIVPAAACAWQVTNVPTWITVTSPAQGVGNGTFTYSVAAQTAGTSRNAVLGIADIPFTVSQAGNACATLTLSPNSVIAPVSGASGWINMSGSAACTWTVTGLPSWVTLTPMSGSITSIQYTYAPNPGASRSVTVSIGGKSLQLAQNGDPCIPAPTVAPASLTFVPGGGTNSTLITAPSVCTWSVTGKPAWITVATTGTGNATLNLTAAANPGTERTATFTVAGNSFTVTQLANACVGAVLAPASASVSSAAGSGTVTLSNPSGTCTWSVTNFPPAWLTVTSPQSGFGSPATITYSYTANAGAARSATLVIAGVTFTLTQAAEPCLSSSLSPSSLSIPFAGGSGTVSLSTSAACNWTVAGVPSWMTVNTSSGSGGAFIGYTVQANPGTARSATVTIAGRTLSVSQAADPCIPAPTISPSSRTFTSAAGTSTVIVTAPSACTWSVTGMPAWISMTTSGTGSLTRNVSAAANPGAERTATFTVAGNSFTVTQAANPCMDAVVTPGMVSLENGAGTGSIELSGVTAACSWTVGAVPSWMTITSSGAGNATIAYSHAANANTGAARSATLTIAGRNVAVTQAAGVCSPAPTLSMSARSVSATGGAYLGSVDVTATPACPWFVAGVPSWITLTSPASGTGNGSVTYDVSSNPGASRTATLSIAGINHTVTQAAPGPGTLPTSRMSTPRSGPAAVSLANGRVLVIGGVVDSSGTVTATSEVFDPTTETFAATGSLSQGRITSGAARLADGRVLVAGGSASGTWLASAEIYDPATGSWSPTGSMTFPRIKPIVLALPDGRALVTGGYVNGASIASTEVFDPATGLFTLVGAATTERESPAAAVLADGRVLLAGGWRSNVYLASAELWNPASGLWSPTGSLPEARSGAAATLLPDGSVLVAGGLGNNGNTVFATAQKYDPATGLFTATGSLNESRYDHKALSLADGSVIALAGFGATNSIERYNPATGSWQVVASSSDGHQSGTATLLGNGKVLLAGGGASNETAELYDPAVCPASVSVSPANATFGGASGSGSITVTMAGNCPRVVSGVPAWVTITAGATGSGSATVTYSVSANTGAARSATFTIAGMPFTVSQALGTPPPPVTYCASKGNNSSMEWIQQVSVAGTVRATSNNGGYSNQTGTAPIPLARGFNAVSLTPGFSGGAYGEYWRVWIDFNGDGVFSDASELVYSGSGTSAISGSFSVPSNVPAGNMRMRISMKWGAGAASCETFSYGEVEDYTVTIP